MHISLEAADKNSIQSYSDSHIQINSIIYHHNLVVSKSEILTGWECDSIQQLNEDNLSPLLHYKPETIIIGHEQSGKLPPFSISEALSRQRIGLECMSIGAACRTFNVLLSEYREVVLAIIFAKPQ